MVFILPRIIMNFAIDKDERYETNIIQIRRL
jgi:hypothetical protein